MSLSQGPSVNTIKLHSDHWYESLRIPLKQYSGASSGIGLNAAVTMANAGYSVLAGVRSDKDGKRVESLHPNIKYVLIDVAKEDSVKRALNQVVDTLDSKGGQLIALVNNAGISCHLPVELTPISDLEELLNVNVIGVYRVTQTFLPLLRASRETGSPRIIVTGSLAGILSPPNMSGYNASKHAMEAFCDSLRIEMVKFGIKVSLLEPGVIDSSIADKVILQKSAAFSKYCDDLISLYQASLEKTRASTEDFLAFSIPPTVTSRAIKHALTSVYPKPRYPVGMDAHFLSFIKAITHWRIADMILYNGSE